MSNKELEPVSNTYKLKLCPFCGSKADIVAMGTSRRSMIIGCVDCGCDLETNETLVDENISWNQRAPQDNWIPIESNEDYLKLKDNTIYIVQDALGGIYPSHYRDKSWFYIDDVLKNYCVVKYYQPLPEPRE
jgi:hypothetical protein